MPEIVASCTEDMLPEGNDMFLPSLATKFTAFSSHPLPKEAVLAKNHHLTGTTDSDLNENSLYGYSDELAYAEINRYNSFKRDDVLDDKRGNEKETVGPNGSIYFPALRTIQGNEYVRNKRISEGSTLVSFHRFFSQHKMRTASSRSMANSDGTLVTGTNARNTEKRDKKSADFLNGESSFCKVEKHNISKKHNIKINETQNINENTSATVVETKLSAEITKITYLLRKWVDCQVTHDSNDALKYLILSSKFFQTSSFDPKESRRVFSIPLKQSMVNLAGASESNEKSDLFVNKNVATNISILDILLALKSVRKTKNFGLLSSHLTTLAAFLLAKIETIRLREMDFKNYLSNFINNLESFNFKLERFECGNSMTTESVVRSSVTPILLSILMSLESLLHEGTPTSQDFWCYYLPMFFQDIGFLTHITTLTHRNSINEFIFQFRKVIQLFLLFLIPSDNVSYANDGWSAIFPDLNVEHIVKDRAAILDKLVACFDQINYYLHAGKDLLGDAKMIQWSQRQNTKEIARTEITGEAIGRAEITGEEIEPDINSPSSQNYEYSELMQRIPCEKETTVDDYEANNYANFEAKLQNLLFSFSINASVTHIDSEMQALLNAWTAYKLTLSNTLQNNSHGLIGEISTPAPDIPTSFRYEEPINHKFLDTLKTLSDVELNDKLQLKLKELHLENVVTQKKKSNMNFNSFSNTLNVENEQFRNLKEDDIALYYQIDELKQNHLFPDDLMS